MKLHLSLESLFFSFRIFVIMPNSGNYRAMPESSSYSHSVYRAFFKASTKGLIVLQGNTIIDVNPIMLAALGFQYEEMVGQSIVSLLPSSLYRADFIRFLDHELGDDYVMIGKMNGDEEVPLSVAFEAVDHDGAIISVQVITAHELGKRAQQAQREEKVAGNERKFEALFNVTFNAYIIHKEGEIVEVNEMFTGLFGYSKDEAITLNRFSELFKDEATYEEYLQHKRKRGRTCYVGRLKRKNGTLFEAEIIAKDEMLDGQEVRIVTVRDVSEMMESERILKEKNEELISRNRDLQLMSNEVISSRQSFYQAIQEKHSDLSDKELVNVIVYGRWTYDFSTSQFIWSDEVKEILGYNAAENKTSLSHFLGQVHAADVDELQDMFYDAAKANKIINQEFRYITPDDGEKVLQVQALAEFKHGKITQLIGTILDITERKQIENRLKRQKDHYMSLNEELIISRKKAEQSEKLKTSFFANMSHEIRTPMNGILGFSGLLMEPELSNEERLEYSQVIVDSGQRLLHIVNDILDISKLESDTFKINKSDVFVNKLLDNLYSLFGQDAKVLSGAVNFTLQKAVADDCVLHTDYNRLSQILTNLLSNAMKFTDEGEVKLGYRLAGDALNFYVEDTGIGVPEDMKTIIFEPFRQVEGHLVKEHGGTGLGLSISKKLTELLGGEMTMDSEEGEGASFSFTLPYEHKRQKKKKEKSLVSQYELKEEIKDVSLLIAEDDEINFMFFKSFLGTRMKLLRASNGQEAIEMVESHPEIDAILMDVKMPIMDGLEATKRIKAEHPDLPIIVQTAYAMLEDKEEVFRAGANDYLTKPINRRDLLEKIKKLCVMQ